ncbi:MAG TPA: hypothetical protein PKH09_04020 [Parvularculaceae bacterium]|nr:hypothetical protein [Parvularculaceae bacterium]
MSLFFRVKTVLAFVFAAPLLCAAASAQSLLRDAEIEQFLNDYSRPVFQAAGLPADQIEILLIGDQSFNAFAGGLVMGVNTGLLTISDNPTNSRRHRTRSGTHSGRPFGALG